MKAQSPHLYQIVQANTTSRFARRAAPALHPAVFPVKGQGTVSVSIDPAAMPHPFEIALAPEAPMLSRLSLTIEQGRVALWACRGNQRQMLASESAPGIGLNAAGEAQPYWLSLDTNNGRVRYGKGETLRVLMLFEYSWNQGGDRTDSPVPFSGSLDRVHVMHANVRAVEIVPIPVNLDPAPRIVPADLMTLEKLSLNTATVVQDLPPACQRLYANVAGAGINMTPEDFPEFPQAIQHSIVTPGCICYEQLKQKDPIFGHLREV